MHHFDSDHHYVDVNDKRLIEFLAQVSIREVARQAVCSASSDFLTAYILHLLIIKKYDLSVH